MDIITILPADWEFLKLILKSLKISTDVKPDKVAHLLFGYPDSDLMKLLNGKKDKSKGFNKENLLKLMRHIARKEENIWKSRGILHQMTQKRGEPVRSFAARL